MSMELKFENAAPVIGSITEGKANQALKKYYTYFDGSMLYITNQ